MKQDFDFMDEAARRALENWEVPFDPNDWAKMEQQLNQGKHLIDEVAKEALVGFEVPFDPNDWALMEEKLNRKEHKMPRLWLFKAVEATVIGLAIFSLFNIATNSSSSGSDSYKGNANQHNSHTNVAVSAAENSNLNKHSVSENNSFKHLHSVLATTAATKQESGLSGNNSPKAGEIQLRATTNNTSALLGKSFQKNTQKVNGALNLPLGISGWAGGNAAHSNKLPLPNTTNNKLGANDENGFLVPTVTNLLGVNNNNTILTTPAFLADNNNGALATTPDLLTTPNNYNTNNINAEAENLAGTRVLLSTTELAALPANNGGGIEDPLFELKRMKPSDSYQRRLRMGAFLGADANMGSSYGNSHLGYSGGWLLETEFSYLFSLQAGVVVSQKNYRSKNSFDVTSPTSEQNYTIEEESVNRLTNISIPIQFQAAFFRNKHWRIGLSAGTMINFIVAKSHVGMQKVYQQGMTLYNQINPNDFERGCWQGASLSNNLYWTVGGGFFAERQLTDKWSLFVQPQYYHSVTRSAVKAGFKVGSFSMTMGVKKAF